MKQLIKASQDENIDEVKLLLVDNIDVNEKDHYGDTALHIACRKGNLEIITELLKYKADTSILNHQGLTALHIASDEAQDAVVQLLLINGANVNIISTTSLKTPLHLAVSLDTLKALKTIENLLAYNANVNAVDNKGNSPLHIAVENGSIEACKLLLAKSNENINITNKNDKTPIYISSLKEYKDIVDLLLNHGANKNDCYVEALFIGDEEYI